MTQGFDGAVQGPPKFENTIPGSQRLLLLLMFCLLCWLVD
jgi:hypothetical protein